MSWQDEGPSAEDIERFSDETGYCPSCGAEVWDGAPACPSCGEMLDRVLTRPPAVHAFETRWRRAIIVLVLLGFLSALVWIII